VLSIVEICFEIPVSKTVKQLKEKELNDGKRKM